MIFSGAAKDVTSNGSWVMWSQRLALPALLFLWLLLIGFELCKVYHTPLWRDDAIFAQPAKNLVLGNGYAVADFGKLDVFSWGISSGPVVILPTALLILLFGNMYWVPGLANVLIINLLLIAAYHRLKVIIKTDVIRRQCCGLFLLICLLVTNHSTGFAGEQMHIWHALMGEIPSALFVIFAALHIAQNRHDPKTIFTGGMLAGLGALCKIQSAIGIAVLGACLAFGYLAPWRSGLLTLRRIAGNCTLYGAGALLPLFLFEAVKALSLGGLHNYLEKARQLQVVTPVAFSASSMQIVCEKICKLGEYLGIMHMPPIPIPLSFLLYLGFIIFAYIKLLWIYAQHTLRRAVVMPTPAEWARDTLLSCCVIHMLWWVFLCSWDMPRYTAQGWLYGAASLALAMACRIDRNFYIGTRNLLIISALILGLRYDAATYLLTAVQPNKSLEEQQLVLQKLKTIKQNDPGTVVFSCGYTYELEYLMPGSANFTECNKLLEPQFAKNTKILLSFTIDDTGRLLQYDSSHFHVIFAPNPQQVLALCPRNDLFQGHNYTIASCRVP